MKNYFLIILSLIIIKFSYSQAPTITEDPTGIIECLGNNAMMKIFATGQEPLSYQWYKNGAPVGTNSNTINFNPLSLSDQGDYYCKVSNSQGEAISLTTHLIVVNEVPTIQNVSTEFDIVCVGTSNLFELEFTGEYSTVAWYNGDNIVGYGSEFNLTNFSISDAGMYHCKVQNACGYAVSQELEIEAASPPIITTQPTSVTVCEGENVTFTVEAEGTALFYYWEKNGTILASEQTSSLEINNLSYPHSDTYNVVVYNICESVTSNLVNINVNTIPIIQGQPESHNICATEAITIYAFGQSTTQVSYQWYNAETGILTGEINDSLVIPVVGGEESVYFCVISNTCGTVSTNIAEITGKTAPIILIQPLGAELCAGDNHTLQVKTEGTEPIIYQWLFNTSNVYGTNISGSQESTMEISEITSGQSGIYTCHISNECGYILSDEAEVIVNIAPNIIEQSLDKSFCEGEELNLNVNIIASPPFEIKWYKQGSTNIISTEANYTIESTIPEDSGDYYCIISNMCGDISSETINVIVKELPEITTNPIGAELCVGDSYLMQITATGAAPLDYVWYRNNSVLSNETDSELTIENAQINQSGTYFCRVINECSYIDSDEAEIIIGTEPAITWNPISQILCEHESLDLIMDAQGENYNLQWYFNYSPIYGQNDTILHFINIGTARSGIYYCLAYNSCATVSTDTVEVIVNTAPQLDLGEDIDLCIGESVFIGPDEQYLHYNWNSGLSNQPSLEVMLSGTFILEVIGENNCHNVDTIIVTFHPYHNILFTNDTIISCGPYTLDAGNGAYSYLWSNNQTSSSIIINNPGLYSVTVSGDEFGCTSSNSIYVDLREPISFELGPNVLAHVDSHVDIGIEHIFSEYLWNTGFTGPKLTVYGSDYGNGEHEFWLTAYALNGCSYSDTISVTFYGQAGIDNDNSNELSIFPNPATNFILIKSNDFLIKSIEFYDISGKLISKEFVNNWEFYYNLSNFAQGLYLIKISGEDNKIINRKILIQ